MCKGEMQSSFKFMNTFHTLFLVVGRTHWLRLSNPPSIVCTKTLWWHCTMRFLGGGAQWWSKSWNGRELHVLASKMCETNHRRNLLLVSGSSKRTPKENHADARDGATLMWRGRYASTYQAECAHSFTTVYTLVHTSMHEPIRSMKMHKAISTISPATLAVGI